MKIIKAFLVINFRSQNIKNFFLEEAKTHEMTRFLEKIGIREINIRSESILRSIINAIEDRKEIILDDMPFSITGITSDGKKDKYILTSTIDKLFFTDNKFFVETSNGSLYEIEFNANIAKRVRFKDIFRFLR